MKKLIKYIAPFLWAVKLGFKANPVLFLITSVSTILTSSLSGVINAYIVAQTTAAVAQLAVGQVSVRTPVAWAVGYGVVNLVLDLIRRASSYGDSIYRNQLDLYVNSLFATKVSSFTQEQLDNANLQSKLNMSARELYSIRNASNTLQSIASAFFAYLFAVLVLWKYAWGIALLLLILIPFLAISNFAQAKRRRESWDASTMYWRISSGLFNYLTDPLRLFQIKIMGARDKLLKLYATNINKSFDLELKAERKNTLYAFIEDVLSALVDVGTRIWAVVLVAGGKLTFSQFLFVLGLIQQASAQTFALGYAISNAQETYLAASVLKEVLEHPSAPEGKQDLPSPENKGIELRFENVSLTYANGVEALKNINLTIPAGAKVAFVGENGAGKSSLLRVMTRQYEPTAGKIFINGMPSTDVRRDSLYEHVSVLDQDYYLFEDLTIKQNVTIVARQPVSESAIVEVLQTVQLKDKVAGLKHGLDTRLDKSYEDGADLSGGQRQRLAIARVLTKNYQLMILDEPTSSIDAKAERSIFNSLFQNSNNATMLIVSHRFSTVRKADYIYVVDNGEIIEQGTHGELMAQKGHYAELYTIQAEDFA